MMSTLPTRDVFFALDSLVYSADVVRRLAGRDKKEWRKRDIVALREARETYFRAMEKLKTMASASASTSAQSTVDHHMDENTSGNLLQCTLPTIATFHCRRTDHRVAGRKGGIGKRTCSEEHSA